MSASVKHFQGLWQIVRFNPWFYVVAIGGLLVGAALTPWRWELLPPLLQVVLLAGYGLACWWTLASLVVSHWVYDRSDWPCGCWFQWIVVGAPIERILNVHAGFDETSDRLRAWLPEASVQSLSLFDPARLTERSIHRAAAYRPSPSDERVGSPEEWPITPQTFDHVCFLLSAHEFRRHEERVALLQRAVESLASREGTTIVLAEHVRDLANFIAFGPGFTHFHSVTSWQQAWTDAGLKLDCGFKVTPFLRVWKLRPLAASHD